MRKEMKKMSFVIILSLVMISFVFPAGQAEQPAMAEGKKVDITLWSLGGVTGQSLTAIIEDLASVKPNINVRMETQGWSALTSIYRSAVASGKEDMDICWANSGPSGSGDIANDEMLVDLTPFFKKYGWDKVIPESFEAYKVNGKYYNFPTDGITVGMLYFSTAKWQELGLTIPNDLDEFYSACTKLKDAGVIPLGLGNKDTVELPYLWNVILARLLPMQDYNALLFGSGSGGAAKIKWNDERVIEAAGLAKEIYEKDFFAPGMLSMDNMQAFQLFASGKLGILSYLQNGATYVHKQAPDLQLDYFQFPQIKKNVPIYTIVSNYNGLIIPKYVEKTPAKLDAVVTFLDFVLKKESMLHYAENGLMPVRNDITEKELSPIVEPTTVKVMGDIKKYGSTEMLDAWLDPKLNDILKTGLVEVITGSITPEEYADKLAERASK